VKILVLGGTRFLGRYFVEAALAKGHELTLFNRGQSNPDLFATVEQVRGSREDLSPLQGRQWDAVLDTCGFFPRIVGKSARALADAVDHYTFISSISVYPEDARGEVDESHPVATMADETVEEITGETYGPLKALCEQAAEAAMAGRVLIVRPGLIVGPHDMSDRFTYWPVRVARGGEVLAPGRPERAAEFIDVRDLANWILHMIEAKQTGVYNATGPDYPLTMQQTLAACKAGANSDAAFTWVDDDFLLKNEVGVFVELPLWIPDEYGGNTIYRRDKAIAAGLTFRPVAETIADTLAWNATRPTDREWRAGLKREREAELLRLWHAAQADASSQH
jgi:2'-hydroxyisoflavone reductase